jgi:hypothetical protein
LNFKLIGSIWTYEHHLNLWAPLPLPTICWHHCSGLHPWPFLQDWHRPCSLTKHLCLTSELNWHYGVFIISFALIYIYTDALMFDCMVENICLLENIVLLCLIAVWICFVSKIRFFLFKLEQKEWRNVSGCTLVGPVHRPPLRIG